MNNDQQKKIRINKKKIIDSNSFFSNHWAEIAAGCCVATAVVAGDG